MSLYVIKCQLVIKKMVDSDLWLMVNKGDIMIVDDCWTPKSFKWMTNLAASKSALRLTPIWVVEARFHDVQRVFFCGCFLPSKPQRSSRREMCDSACWRLWLGLGSRWCCLSTWMTFQHRPGTGKMEEDRKMELWLCAWLFVVLVLEV